MAKMNDVHVVSNYRLNTGYADGEPNGDNFIRMHWLSDGTVVGHSGIISLYSRDGILMKPKELYDYLKGLAGRRGILDGVQKLLRIGPYGSYNTPRWFLFNEKTYNEVGIPELFDSPPMDNSYLGPRYGVSTIIQALYYGMPEILGSGHEPIDENFEEEELQPDLTLDECIRETEENKDRYSKAVGSALDSVDKENKTLELLKWAKAKAAGRLQNI